MDKASVATAESPTAAAKASAKAPAKPKGAAPATKAHAKASAVSSVLVKRDVDFANIIKGFEQAMKALKKGLET